MTLIRERSSMVEYQLPKLATGVRFPSLAPIKSGAIGFILLALTLAGCATSPTRIAQSTPLPNVEGIHYTVRPGDTLWSISRMYGVDMDNLVRVNGIADTTAIEKGRVIIIPVKLSGYEKPEYKSYERSESFAWPIQGHTISFYGSKQDNIINKGIDIGALEGSSVRAARNGRVVYCDSHQKGFGKTVIIDHGDRFQTVYSYNSEILVNVGDSVRQHDVIARVGRTGRAKQPSLHFEIRKDGQPQNPSYYLPR